MNGAAAEARLLYLDGWPVHRRLAAWREVRRILMRDSGTGIAVLRGWLGGFHANSDDPPPHPEVWPTPWEILAHGGGPLSLAILGAATLAAVGIEASVGLRKCGPHDRGEPVVAVGEFAFVPGGETVPRGEVEIVASAEPGLPPRWKCPRNAAA